jgi:hypothetical protein
MSWRLSNHFCDDDGMYLVELTAVLDLTVGSKQQALLFLNERSNNNPMSYIFTAQPRQEDTDTVVFLLSVKEGEYLVRVQVDGAESPLEVDADLGYVSPFIQIKAQNKEIDWMTQLNPLS